MAQFIGSSIRFSKYIIFTGSAPSALLLLDDQPSFFSKYFYFNNPQIFLVFTFVFRMYASMKSVHKYTHLNFFCKLLF